MRFNSNQPTCVLPETRTARRKVAKIKRPQGFYFVVVGIIALFSFVSWFVLKVAGVI